MVLLYPLGGALNADSHSWSDFTAVKAVIIKNGVKWKTNFIEH